MPSLLTATIVFAGTLAVATLAASTAFAQHTDVEFVYANQKIEITPGPYGPVATGRFTTSGIFQQNDTNPGFASEIDAGAGIGPHDTIVYNVLSGLLFWNGEAFAQPAESLQLRIDNNITGTPDTWIDANSGLQPGSSSPGMNAVGRADGNGDFHSHVAFNLEPNPWPSTLPSSTHGAYGIKLSLSTDALGIADSDPFFIVFNFGLSTQDFVTATQAFGALLAPSLPGDYNGDGMVDAADYTVWRNSLGSTTDLAANGDDTGPSAGVIDQADYLVWKSHFGSTLSAPLQVAASAVVPEPRTVWLLAGAAAVLLTIRRGSPMK